MKEDWTTLAQEIANGETDSLEFKRDVPSEKLKILRDEGKVDDALAAVLREFEYKGAKAYRTNPAHDVLRRTEALVHTRSAASESGAGQP